MGTLEDKRRAVDEGTYEQNWQTGQEFVDTHPGALEAMQSFNSGESERLEQERYMREIERLRVMNAYKVWAIENRLQLSIGVLTGLLTLMVINEPVKYAPVFSAVGDTAGKVITGFGEIIKGIGEVVPL